MPPNEKGADVPNPAPNPAPSPNPDPNPDVLLPPTVAVRPPPVLPAVLAPNENPVNGAAPDKASGGATGADPVDTPTVNAPTEGGNAGVERGGWVPKVTVDDDEDEDVMVVDLAATVLSFALAAAESSPSPSPSPCPPVVVLSINSVLP